MLIDSSHRNARGRPWNGSICSEHAIAIWHKSEPIEFVRPSRNLTDIFNIFTKLRNVPI